jgi:hypothetical protein
MVHISERSKRIFNYLIVVAIIVIGIIFYLIGKIELSDLILFLTLVFIATYTILTHCMHQEMINQSKLQSSTDWIKAISEHNWRSLEYDLHSGLETRCEDAKIKISCYQHMNLIYMAWLHRKVVNDNNLVDLKRWVKYIKYGANIEGNEEYSYCYFRILENKDMYPDDFIDWLKEKLNMSLDDFWEKKI